MTTIAEIAAIRISEIKAALGYLLDELNLIPVMKPTDYGADIEFKPADPHFQSAVTLSLHPAALKPEKPSWRKSALHVRRAEIRKLGETGWVHTRLSIENMRLGDISTEKTMDLLSKALRQHKVYPSSSNPTATDNIRFVNAHASLEHILGKHGIDDLQCKRVDGVECFTFVDQRNRDWRIAVTEEHLAVYVEEEIVETFKSNDDTGLMVYVGNVLYDVPYRR